MDTSANGSYFQPPPASISDTINIQVQTVRGSMNKLTVPIGEEPVKMVNEIRKEFELSQAVSNQLMGLIQRQVLYINKMGMRK